MIGPDFIIVGAMKAGTSFVRRTLPKHPRIKMLSNLVGRGHNRNDGEFHYFDKAITKKSLVWYMEQFDKARKGGNVVGEKSPSYLADPKVITNIALSLPQVKLVVLLRDPVTRWLSHVKQANKIRPKQANLTARQIMDDRPLLRADMLWRGHYEPQLDLVLRLFGKESVHIVWAQDLRAAPGLTFAGLQDFLGVERQQIYTQKTQDSREKRANKSPDDVVTFLRDYYKPHNEALAALLESDRPLEWSSHHA